MNEREKRALSTLQHTEERWRAVTYDALVHAVAATLLEIDPFVTSRTIKISAKKLRERLVTHRVTSVAGEDGEIVITVEARNAEDKP